MALETEDLTIGKVIRSASMNRDDVIGLQFLSATTLLTLVISCKGKGTPLGSMECGAGGAMSERIVFGAVRSVETDLAAITAGEKPWLIPFSAESAGVNCMGSSQNFALAATKFSREEPGIRSVLLPERSFAGKTLFGLNWPMLGTPSTSDAAKAVSPGFGRPPTHEARRHFHKIYYSTIYGQKQPKV